MELVVKITLILLLLTVCYEDVTERQTYWFWFPLMALVLGVLHLNQTVWPVFVTSVGINLCVVWLFLILIYGYARLKLGVHPRQVFGLGDAFLFLALAFSFSTISFITVFVFALVFSLVLHMVLNTKSKPHTVPLAGYMSLFFAITYIAYWFEGIDSLYLI